MADRLCIYTHPTHTVSQKLVVPNFGDTGNYQILTDVKKFLQCTENLIYK